jgi:hypothetical protein
MLTALESSSVHDHRPVASTNVRHGTAVRNDQGHHRLPMKNPRTTSQRASRLVWVGVIAAVAALLTGWWRWESALVALAMAGASAAISIGIVWLVGRSRGLA